MYAFTGNQLADLLIQTMELYQEYVDVHRKGIRQARAAAALDTIEGLDAERELYHAGEISELKQQEKTREDIVATQKRRLRARKRQM